ncbi:uncharacterized protein [Phaseolus vulgaris]|uniref:uncharacterized protein n=1 Tax=Phaseolus vulgaris TaxID=3885 RepID=UPI0035CC51C2
MWGTNEIDWIERGVKNNASGMITIWMRSCFHLANVITGENYCIIQGEWSLGEASRITIVNIYNFGSLIEKSAIWEEVWERRRMQISTTWCVVGDFNYIRRLGDRRSVNTSMDYSREMRRSLDVWKKDGRFKDFVRTKWESYEVQGCGIFVFKEKLKKLKEDLKVWNIESFGNINLAGEEV